MHPDLFPGQILEDLINSSGLSKYVYDIDLQMEGAKDLNFLQISENTFTLVQVSKAIVKKLSFKTNLNQIED